MKVINLTEGSRMYTCNAYLVLGSWNTLEDINTLVDVGRDPLLFERLEGINTGVGKKRVERVIITHNHYDHTGILQEVADRYHPEILSFSNTVPGVTRLLRNGDTVRMGDTAFRVLHSEGHSSDSVCLLAEEEGVLFCGDNNLSIPVEGNFCQQYVETLRYLSRHDVSRIYYGHGKPETEQANSMIRRALLKGRNGLKRKKEVNA